MSRGGEAECLDQPEQCGEGRRQPTDRPTDRPGPTGIKPREPDGGAGGSPRERKRGSIRGGNRGSDRRGEGGMEAAMAWRECRQEENAEPEQGCGLIKVIDRGVEQTHTGPGTSEQTAARGGGAVSAGDGARLGEGRTRSGVLRGDTMAGRRRRVRAGAWSSCKSSYVLMLNVLLLDLWCPPCSAVSPSNTARLDTIGQPQHVIQQPRARPCLRAPGARCCPVLSLPTTN